MSRLRSDLLEYKSKYEYPNGVLINKLEIKDNDTLEKAERVITTRQLAKLYLTPISNNISFDVNYYLGIHKYLFQDIYPFAGEIRNENIYKSFSFCPPENIYNELNRTLTNANKVVPFLDSKEKLLTFLVEFYSDLDVIHPFREGNGRTLREFIRQFIDYICKINNLEPYYLDYASIERDRYIHAVVQADAYLNYSELLEMFTEILRIKDENKRKK